MKSKLPGRTVLILLLLLVTGLFLPAITSDPYFLHVFIIIFIWSILTFGIRIVLVVGHLNAAQAGFMGMGAYFSALLTMRLGWSFWVSLPVSALLAAILALVIGYPILRVKGPYFVMITFGITEVFRQIWMMWKSLFGGPQGLFGIPKPTPIDLAGIHIAFTGKLPFYYLAFIVLIITVLVMWRLDNSRLGMTLRSLPQSEPLSESIGVPIIYYKLLAFVIGSFFAGLAGAIWAHYFTYTSPFDFTWMNSQYMLMYAVIGGTQSVLGPIVGCITLLCMDELLRDFVQYTPIIVGLILVFVLLYLPGGLITLPDKIYSLISGKRNGERYLTSGQVILPKIIHSLIAGRRNDGKQSDPVVKN